MPLVGSSPTPGGSVPEATAKVGAGLPLAVKVYVYAAPTWVELGGAAAVNCGAAFAATTSMISCPVVAGVPTVLDAVMVKVKWPAVVGVPLSCPVRAFSVIPG